VVFSFGLVPEKLRAGEKGNQRNQLKFMEQKRETSESPAALKMREARAYLGGLSVPTMHRLIQRGLLRPNKSTRHLLFPVSELERFLRDGQT